MDSKSEAKAMACYQAPARNCQLWQNCDRHCESRWWCWHAAAKHRYPGDFPTPLMKPGPGPAWTLPKEDLEVQNLLSEHH
mmetsp:Transcript_58075/g.147545  ORF Transcript_58075/g.147545 Transcript_58075/m.147545 type:complete len:80 (+) Transcript_58075:1746-1985(+)